MKLVQVACSATVALMSLILPASAGEAAAFGSNLVVNGDAETGTAAGFITTGGFAALAYGTGGGFPSAGDPGVAEGGTFFFYGGQANQSSGSQMIDLSANANAIDLGSVNYSLAALLGGYSNQDDNAVITASFLSASGTTLGAGVVGPVLAATRNSQTGLIPESTSGLLPTGTRSVNLLIGMTKTAGSDNDGYVDNLSFVLNQSVASVPEPASWAMFIGGFGLVGGAMRRRRVNVSFA